MVVKTLDGKAVTMSRKSFVPRFAHLKIFNCNLRHMKDKNIHIINATKQSL